MPYGPCLAKDNFLDIAQQNRVPVYPTAGFFWETAWYASIRIEATLPE